MKRILCAALLLALLALPSLGLMESEDTVRLAKTLYTLGKGESYDTLLDLGSVVMNRVDSPWYPDTVMGVLRQPHQCACGTLYDATCYQAARAVLMGRRTLPSGAVIYHALDASAPGGGGEVVKVSGNYEFMTGENY